MVDILQQSIDLEVAFKVPMFDVPNTYSWGRHIPWHSLSHECSPYGEQSKIS